MNVELKRKVFRFFCTVIAAIIVAFVLQIVFFGLPTFLALDRIKNNFDIKPISLPRDSVKCYVYFNRSLQCYELQLTADTRNEKKIKPHQIVFYQIKRYIKDYNLDIFFGLFLSSFIIMLLMGFYDNIFILKKIPKLKKSISELKYTVINSVVKINSEDIKKNLKKKGEVCREYVISGKKLLCNELLSNNFHYYKNFEQAKTVVAFSALPAAQWFVPGNIEYLLRCGWKCNKDLKINNTINIDWYEKNILDIISNNIPTTFIRIFIYNDIDIKTGEDNSDECLKTIINIHEKLHIPYLFVHRDTLYSKLEKKLTTKEKEQFIDFVIWQLNSHIKLGFFHKFKDWTRSYYFRIIPIFSKNKDFRKERRETKKINFFFKRWSEVAKNNEIFLDFAIFVCNNYHATYYQNKSPRYDNIPFNIMKIILKSLLDENNQLNTNIVLRYLETQ